MLAGTLRDPSEENKGNFGSCLGASSPTRIYVKLDYISSLLPQTTCLGKIFGPRYLGPKLTKSAILRIFFNISNITVKICMVEENFRQINWRGDHFTPYFNFFNSPRFFFFFWCNLEKKKAKIVQKTLFFQYFECNCKNIYGRRKILSNKLKRWLSNTVF